MNRRLLLLWYALAGGVGWWVVHLVGVSALARPACTEHLSWTINGLTALTAVGALSSVWASLAVRSDPSPVAAVTGRARFLGDIAILFNVASLALIVLEGLPPLFLGTCR